MELYCGLDFHFIHLLIFFRAKKKFTPTQNNHVVEYITNLLPIYPMSIRLRPSYSLMHLHRKSGDLKQVRDNRMFPKKYDFFSSK